MDELSQEAILSLLSKNQLAEVEQIKRDVIATGFGNVAGAALLFRTMGLTTYADACYEIASAIEKEFTWLLEE